MAGTFALMVTSRLGGFGTKEKEKRGCNFASSLAKRPRASSRIFSSSSGFLDPSTASSKTSAYSSPSPLEDFSVESSAAFGLNSPGFSAALRITSSQSPSLHRCTMISSMDCAVSSDGASACLATAPGWSKSSTVSRREFSGRWPAETSPFSCHGFSATWARSSSDNDSRSFAAWRSWRDMRSSLAAASASSSEPPEALHEQPSS
mmetsp:Transcript_18084/g.54534  ORF Transcript_18084/g.54534 Transcript_18084/m.54534 type:complete len:205 (+) Transcript_18084:820-1434(+)